MSARDFANEDYRDLNRVDRDTAYRELQDLIDRGLIQASGAGAGTRYRVIKGALAPTTAPPTPTELLVRRMESTGFITNADYREAFGVDRYQAKQALARWTATNVLVREGERRAARYRAGPSWPPV